MQPNPPAPGGTPEPADSLKALDAQLVDVMAQAEIAANAQRDLEAGTPPGETDRHEATPPQPGDETDDDEDDDTVPAGDAQEESEEDVDGEQDEDDEAEEPPSPAPAQQQQQLPTAATPLSPMDSSATST
jgi:hypothetical protein